SPCSKPPFSNSLMHGSVELDRSRSVAGWFQQPPARSAAATSVFRIARKASGRMQLVESARADGRWLIAACTLRRRIGVVALDARLAHLVARQAHERLSRFVFVRALLAKPIPLEELVQELPLEAGDARGLRQVAAGALDEIAQVLALELRDEL